MLVALARQLDSLLEELVFVGGHVAELLITSSGATRVRPTLDVDAVVTSATRAAYHQIEKRLSELVEWKTRCGGRLGEPAVLHLLDANVLIDSAVNWHPGSWPIQTLLGRLRVMSLLGRRGSSLEVGKVFSRELQFFIDHQDELVEKYQGRVLVLRGGRG